ALGEAHQRADRDDPEVADVTAAPLAVELRLAADQVAIDAADRLPRTIRTGAAHRVDHVDHRGDPGQFAQLLALQRQRIAAAIQTLIDALDDAADHRLRNPLAAAHARAQHADVGGEFAALLG